MKYEAMTDQPNQNPVTRTLKYIVPYWYYIIISTIGGILKMTLPLILPQTLKYFTDDLLSPQNTMPAAEKLHMVYKCLLFLLCLYAFVYIPATYLREVGALRVSNRIIHKMRCQLYEHLLLMSAKFHENNKSGELVSRINSDVEQVHDFIWSVATNIWIDSFLIIIYIALMLPISVPLTLICLIILPASILLTKQIRIQIRQNGRKRQEELARISGYFQERMAGFSVIRLFHIEREENKKFNGLSSEIFKYTKKRDTFSSSGIAISAAFYLLIQTIIICLSAAYVVKGEMTLGSLFVFYTYADAMLTPLRRFAELNVTYAKSMVGIERIYAILDTPPDIAERENAISLNPNAAMDLKFEHISFQYGREHGEKALDDISFSIHEGEKAALVGSSGCGKTTLVNLITRFYDPDAGNIWLSGHKLEEYSLESLYGQIGMVFQDTVLFSETIADNLRYAKANATPEEMEAAAKAANAYDFIMKAPDQWNTMLGERGIGLSGGQKQRLSIARIFLRNPKFLILDEATSALDSESEELVQSALDKLMKGRTSIVIAHRLSTIINSDKIIVMDKGRIVESGSHHELLEKNGRYAELYRKQFKDVLEQV